MHWPPASRDRHLVGDASALICALVVAKEKQLVLDDRAADGTTILLPGSGREWLAGELGEWIACLLVAVSIIEEAAAVEFVDARLDLNRDRTGDGFADFRVEILVSDLGFLNGVQVRIDDDNPEDGILVIGTVEFEGRAAEVLAVHHDLLAALGVFCGGVAPADELLRAGRKQLEVCKVAIQDGKVFDIFLIETDGDVRAVRLDLRNFSADFNGLRHRAQLELSVDAC